MNLCSQADFYILIIFEAEKKNNYFLSCALKSQEQ